MIAIESLVGAAKSAAALVPNALGVQEAGYAALAPLFGIGPEFGLAVSFLVGAPATSPSARRFCCSPRPRPAVARWAAPRAASLAKLGHQSALAEPAHGVREGLDRRPRGIAQIALGLCAGKEHALARHSQTLERETAAAPGDSCDALRPDTPAAAPLRTAGGCAAACVPRCGRSHRESARASCPGPARM